MPAPCYLLAFALISHGCVDHWTHCAGEAAAKCPPLSDTPWSDEDRWWARNCQATCRLCGRGGLAPELVGPSMKRQRPSTTDPRSAGSAQECSRKRSELCTSLTQALNGRWVPQGSKASLSSAVELDTVHSTCAAAANWAWRPHCCTIHEGYRGWCGRSLVFVGDSIPWQSAISLHESLHRLGFICGVSPARAGSTHCSKPTPDGLSCVLHIRNTLLKLVALTLEMPSTEHPHERVHCVSAVSDS